MTTKEKILETLYQHKGQSLGVVGATYDDCIDVVASMPDRELKQSQVIADLRAAVSELESILGEHTVHAHWIRTSRIWYKCSHCGKFITTANNAVVPDRCWNCEAIMDEEVQTHETR